MYFCNKIFCNNIKVKTMQTNKIISEGSINRLIYILILCAIASFFGACNKQVENANNCGQSFFAPVEEESRVGAVVPIVLEFEEFYPRVEEYIASYVRKGYKSPTSEEIKNFSENESNEYMLSFIDIVDSNSDDDNDFKSYFDNTFDKFVLRKEVYRLVDFFLEKKEEENRKREKRMKFALKNKSVEVKAEMQLINKLNSFYSTSKVYSQNRQEEKLKKEEKKERKNLENYIENILCLDLSNFWIWDKIVEELGKSIRTENILILSENIKNIISSEFQWYTLQENSDYKIFVDSSWECRAFSLYKTVFKYNELKYNMHLKDWIEYLQKMHRALNSPALYAEYVDKYLDHTEVIECILSLFDVKKYASEQLETLLNMLGEKVSKLFITKMLEGNGYMDGVLKGNLLYKHLPEPSYEYSESLKSLILNEIKYDFHEGFFENNTKIRAEYLAFVPINEKPKCMLINVYGGAKFNVDVAIDQKYKQSEMEKDFFKGIISKGVLLTFLNLNDHFENRKFQAEMESVVFDRVLQGIELFIENYKNSLVAGLPKDLRIFLMGSSFGGLVTTRFLQKNNIKKLVDGGISWDGPLSQRRFSNEEEIFDGCSMRKVQTKFNPYLNPSNYASELKTPLLVMQNLADNNVQTENALHFITECEKYKTIQFIHPLFVKSSSHNLNEGINLGHFLPDKSSSNYLLVEEEILSFMTDVIEEKPMDLNVSEKRIKEARLYAPLTKDAKPNAAEFWKAIAAMLYERHIYASEYKSEHDLNFEQMWNEYYAPEFLKIFCEIFESSFIIGSIDSSSLYQNSYEKGIITNVYKNLKKIIELNKDSFPNVQSILTAYMKKKKLDALIPFIQEDHINKILSA